MSTHNVFSWSNKKTTVDSPYLDLASKEQFLLFSTNDFNISRISRVQLHIHCKCGCSIYFFLSSAILICRGTDIYKYFRESLGVRDNESQLYLPDTALIWSYESCLFREKSTAVFSYFTRKSLIYILASHYN